MLFTNIPLVRQFLSLIVQDWKGRLAPEQLKVDSASEDRVPLIVGALFGELQPYYLKCLFSYVMMFCSLDKAYAKFYKELGQLNRDAKLAVSPPQAPARTSYIRKVKTIRDISIAHMISDQASPIDAAAAAMWQPMTIQKNAEGKWDLGEMTFGALRLTGTDTKTRVSIKSADFRIQGIEELNTHCLAFIDKWDTVCSSYLSWLTSKLPHATSEARFYQLSERV